MHRHVYVNRSTEEVTVILLFTLGHLPVKKITNALKSGINAVINK
ncbi:hypothetical protein WwAna0983 [Wolbachia endosymbiont of Drosophila ananassae]|nr:hypothetical protein WwAna0983 [Wolbachia endosymbiont of Drosophila ananassae]